MMVQCKKTETETGQRLDFMKIDWNKKISDRKIELLNYLQLKQSSLRSSISDMKERLAALCEDNQNRLDLMTDATQEVASNQPGFERT